MIPEMGLDVTTAFLEPCLPLSVCKMSFTVFLRKIVQMIEVLLVVVIFFYRFDIILIYVYFLAVRRVGS